MYKAAIKNKLTGAVISLVMLFVFLIIVIVFLKGAPLFLLGGILVLFIALMFSSVYIYMKHLSEVKGRYGQSLERDINVCKKNVVGKYFFLENALVDMANAKMVLYREMKSASGVTTGGSHRYPSGHSRYAGAAVEIKTISGGTFIVYDFNSSYAKSSQETRQAYNQFVGYLKEAAPDIEWKN